MQVIFCRNVLMYFGHELQDQVLHKFAQSLCPGGFLCLGAGERLSQGGRKVFKDFASNQRIFRYQGAP
jgi:chemotaxis protein methyltransferase CheR